MTEFIYAVAVVIVAFTINKFIEKFINAPRLKATYNRLLDGHIFTGHYEEGKTGLFSGASYNRIIDTLSISVQNNNTSIAKGCRLILLEIENGVGTEGGHTHRLKQQIGWAKDQYATGFVAAEIPKGINLTALVATGYVDSPKKEGEGHERDFVSLNLEGERNYMRNVMWPNHDFRLKFVVTAENAEPYHFECVVECDTSRKMPIFTVKRTRGWYESPWYTFFDSLKSEISVKTLSF